MSTSNKEAKVEHGGISVHPLTAAIGALMAYRDNLNEVIARLCDIASAAPFAPVGRQEEIVPSPKSAKPPKAPLKKPGKVKYMVGITDIAEALSTKPMTEFELRKVLADRNIKPSETELAKVLKRGQTSGRFLLNDAGKWQIVEND